MSVTEIFIKFEWIFIVLGGLVGLIVCGLLGYAAYVVTNELIDRYQGRVRRNRPMATSMTAQALREKRQSDAAARRLQIRVENSWSVK